MPPTQRFAGWIAKIDADTLNRAEDAQLAALVRSSDAINRMFGSNHFECSGQGVMPYAVGVLTDPGGEVVRTGA